MRVKIINIGNSQGIIIPKKLIDHYKLGSEVEIITPRGHLEIHPIESTRVGWEEAFTRAQASEKDFDTEEWTW